MQNKHWGLLILVLVVGYFLGVTWPAFGQGAVAKVQGAIGA